jgi:hypothetical protein
MVRRWRPSAEQEISFGYLAVGVLNGALRPLLAVWHPTLAAYEATRPQGRSPVEWERQWSRAEELRSELAATRGLLVEFARTVGEVAGAASLLPRDPAGQTASRMTASQHRLVEGTPFRVPAGRGCVGPRRGSPRPFG